MRWLKVVVVEEGGEVGVGGVVGVGGELCGEVDEGAFGGVGGEGGVVEEAEAEEGGVVGVWVEEFFAGLDEVDEPVEVVEGFLVLEGEFGEGLAFAFVGGGCEAEGGGEGEGVWADFDGEVIGGGGFLEVGGADEEGVAGVNVVVVHGHMGFEIFTIYDLRFTIWIIARRRRGKTAGGCKAVWPARRAAPKGRKLVRRA